MKIIQNLIPIFFIISIIIVLYYLGYSKALEYQSIDNYTDFKLALQRSIFNAKNIVHNSNYNVFICSLNADKTSCGSQNDWINGIMVYKRNKISSIDIISKEILDINDELITETSEININPSDKIANDYHFILKSKQKSLYPNELTIHRDLSISEKLITKDFPSIGYNA